MHSRLLSRTVRSLFLPFLLALVASLLTAVPTHATTGTHVGGILSADTTWTATGGPYYVDSTVQIPAGVTLRIEPGAEVYRGTLTGSSTSFFVVAGTLNAAGTGGSPVLFDGSGSGRLATPASSATHAEIFIRNATVSNFDSIFFSNSGGYSDYVLTDSVVRRIDYFTYIWYPKAEVRIERNLFVDAGTLSIGKQSTATGGVFDNRFRGVTPTNHYPTYIESWAAYGERLQVHGNTFEPGPAPQYALAVRSDGAIDATGNDWGTLDVSEAKRRVLDAEDDINLPSVVPVEPLLAGPSASSPRTVPLPPVNSAATSGDKQATVSWTPPASDGGSPVTGYRVRALPGGATATATAAARSVVVDGLTNGTAYTFEVTALNALGASASTTTTPVTPAGPPSAPGSVTADPLDRGARISWTAAAPNGTPITGYRVTLQPGDREVTTGPDGRSAEFTGLTNESTYEVNVVATSGAGAGPAGTTTVTPHDTTRPTVTVTSSPPLYVNTDEQTVTWTVSDPVDDPQQLRTACAVDGAAPTPCSSPLTLTGLGDGKHRLAITATDPWGNTGQAVEAWTVDRTAPTADMAAPLRWLVLGRHQIRWTRTDAIAAASSDVRQQTATPHGRVSAWSYPQPWQRTTATSAHTPAPPAGRTVCFATRAHDEAGNASGWTATRRCAAAPLDDRDLRTSAGWRRSSATGSWKSTLLSSSRKGASARTTVVKTRKVALVAQTRPGAGVVGVYLDGRLLRKVNLASSRVRNQRVLEVASWNTLRRGTVTVKVLRSGARGVAIDGVGLLSR